MFPINQMALTSCPLLSHKPSSINIRSKRYLFELSLHGQYMITYFAAFQHKSFNEVPIRLKYFGIVGCVMQCKSTVRRIPHTNTKARSTFSALKICGSSVFRLFRVPLLHDVCENVVCWSLADPHPASSSAEQPAEAAAAASPPSSRSYLSVLRHPPCRLRSFRIAPLPPPTLQPVHVPPTHPPPLRQSGSHHWARPRRSLIGPPPEKSAAAGPSAEHQSRTSRRSSQSVFV
ncbi:hypothetical protein QTP88_011523 [Uroleucon formosanum]